MTRTTLILVTFVMATGYGDSAIPTSPTPVIGTLVPTLTRCQKQLALFEVLLVRQRWCVAGISVSGLHLGSLASL